MNYRPHVNRAVMSFLEIGNELGISANAAAIIYKDALRKLKLPRYTNRIRVMKALAESKDATKAFRT